DSLALLFDEGFSVEQMVFDVVMTVWNAIFQSILIFIGYLLFLWLSFALSMIAHDTLTPYHVDERDMTDDMRWEAYFLTSPIQSVSSKEVSQLVQESKQLTLSPKTSIVSKPKYSLDLWKSKLARLEFHKRAEQITLMIYVLVSQNVESVP
ncbi:MAG: hypothetical protein JSV04_03265, partial [Candidatus Heimdallarchaeota archaeon]